MADKKLLAKQLLSNKTRGTNTEGADQAESDHEHAGRLEELKPLVDNYINLAETAYEKYNQLGKIDTSMKVKEDDESIKNVVQIGKSYYTQGYYYDAVLKFTCAIKAYPHICLEICLCYLRRSAALFALGLYTECINDLEMVVSLLALKTFHLPQYKMDDLLNRLLAARKRKEQTKQPENNPEVQELKIGSDYSVKWGNHVIAKKNVKAGEVIIVEKPFSMCCIEIEDLHCYHCMEVTFCPIPCVKCCNVQFCSSSCRHEAWIRYHEIECNILLNLKKYKEYSIVWRTVLSVYKLPEDEFKKILNLQVEESNFDKNDIKNLEEIAAGIAHLIHVYLSDFIVGKNKESQFTIVKGMILKLMYIKEMYCRTQHMAVKLPKTNHKIFDLKWCSLFSSQTGYNHSCVPNVIVTRCGIANILWALEDIKANQQLFICYNDYYFWSHSRSERIANQLRKLGLTCRCVACVENWGVEYNFSRREFEEIFRPLRGMEWKLDRQMLDPNDKDKYDKYFSEHANRRWTKPSAEYILYVRCFLKWLTFKYSVGRDAFDIVIKNFPFLKHYACNYVEGRYEHNLETCKHPQKSKPQETTQEAEDETSESDCDQSQERDD